MSIKTNKAVEKKYGDTKSKSGKITKHPILKRAGVVSLIVIAVIAATYVGIKYNHIDEVNANMQDSNHAVYDDGNKYENPSTDNGGANTAEDGGNENDSSKPDPDLDPNRPSRPDPNKPIEMEFGR